jgi:choline kinase
MASNPTPPTRAIILAAGLSSRLYPATHVQHKTMLELTGGRRLIDVQFDFLARLGITDTTVVTGHAAEPLEEHVGGRAATRRYADYAAHGNLHTLHSVRDLLEGRVLVAFADLVAGFGLWERVAKTTSEFGLLVDEGRSIPGTMRTQGDGVVVTDLGPHIPVEEGTGTFVGLGVFSPAATAALREQMDRMVDQPEWENCVYTYALAALVQAGRTLTSVPTLGEPWIEVDDAADYSVAVDLAKSWSS